MGQATRGEPAEPNWLVGFHQVPASREITKLRPGQPAKFSARRWRRILISIRISEWLVVSTIVIAIYSVWLTIGITILIGGFNPLKNMSSSDWIIIPTIGENKPLKP